MGDEGIYVILGETCNNDTHGDMWARSCEEQLKTMGWEMQWLHKRPRRYVGLAGEVSGIGKPAIPFNTFLTKLRMTLRGVIEPTSL